MGGFADSRNDWASEDCVKVHLSVSLVILFEFAGLLQKFLQFPDPRRSEMILWFVIFRWRRVP